LTGTVAGRPHQTLYWRIDGMWAVRDGDWKLVHGQPGSDPPELFDLASDAGESRNRAAQHPEMVKELQAHWDAWNAQQAGPSTARDRAAKAEKRKAKKAKRE
jgi:arylsulfatase A-like enzyme